MPSTLFAIGLSLGGAAVDSGDNRLVPALQTSLSFSDYSYDLIYYGQQSSIFTQKYLLLTGERRWQTGLGNLEVGTGLLFMAESISYHPGEPRLGEVDKSAHLPADPPVTAESDLEHAYYNGAALLGLHYRWMIAGAVWMEFGWSSQIFPAGSQILLMTADIHDVFSFKVGVGR